MSEVKYVNEHDFTAEVLQSVQGDAIAAANLLGVHKSTIYRRLRRAQLDGPVSGQGFPIAAP